RRGPVGPLVPDQPGRRRSRRGGHVERGRQRGQPGLLIATYAGVAVGIRQRVAVRGQGEGVGRFARLAFAGQARGERQRAAVLGEDQDRPRTFVEADVVVVDVQARDIATALARGGVRGPVAAVALGHVDVADVVAIVFVFGVARRRRRGRLVAGGIGAGRADGRVVGAVGGPVVGGVARAQQGGDGKHGQGIPHGVLLVAVDAEHGVRAVIAACFTSGNDRGPRRVGEFFQYQPLRASELVLADAARGEPAVARAEALDQGGNHRLAAHAGLAAQRVDPLLRAGGALVGQLL